MKRLNRYSIFAFLLILYVNASADPLASCNDALSGLSTEIQSSIRDLAKLRFDLDQKLSQGENDSIMRALSAQYEKKEAEVLLASGLSREAFIEKLKTEVKAIQEATDLETSRRSQKQKVEQRESAESKHQVTPLGEMSVERNSFVLTLLPDGNVLVAGDGSRIQQVKSIEVIDPKTGVSKVVGELKDDRGYHGQSVIHDGRVVMTGGWVSDQSLASIERFDPNSGLLESIGNLKEARQSHSQDLLPSGKLLIVGGDINGNHLSSIELLDPITGESNIIGYLEEGRDSHQSTLLPDGRVLIVGGSYYLDPRTTNSRTSIELIDLNTKTSKIIGQLGFPRIAHAQSLLRDGRVMITGGFARSSYFDLIEVIDPDSGKVETIGRLKVPRMQHAQTTLSDGRVLVTGGLTYDGKTINTVELIDPKTGDSEVIAELKTERRFHRQILVKDNQVLVVGGDRDKVNLKTIELIKVGRR